MRSKSEKRLLSEQLRKEQGLSYNEIAHITGVSKSTLSNWLKHIQLKPEQEARLQAHLMETRASFAARALPINRDRYRKAREQAFAIGAAVIEQLPEDPCVDQLAFAMLYLGEGTKTGNSVQLASTDPYILRFFIYGLKALYHIDASKIFYRINLVEAARNIELQILDWWSYELDIERERFKKTQYDHRSKATSITGNYHGVCTASCYDTYLQQQIIGLATTYINRYR